jgi:hypothetical protein
MCAPKAVAAVLCASCAGIGYAWAAETSAETREDARDFLLRYAGLTAAADAAVIELYEDDARIRLTTLTHAGAQLSLVIIGHQWKRELRAGWLEGGVRLEPSSFANLSVRHDADRLQLRAQRYSHARCYWDRGYEVTLQPDAVGRYRIVEERLTIQRDATCPPNAPVAMPRHEATTPQRPTSDPRHVIPTSPGSLPPNVMQRQPLAPAPIR